MNPESNLEPNSPGRYAYDGLDRLLHEKARLGILTSLAARPEGLLFNELKGLVTLTDGNLSRHLQLLEDASLIEVWKGYHRRRPQTLVRLSAAGKARFLAYLAELERVIHDAAAVRAALARETAPPGVATGAPSAPDKGWAPA